MSNKKSTNPAGGYKNLQVAPEFFINSILKDAYKDIFKGDGSQLYTIKQNVENLSEKNKIPKESKHSIDGYLSNIQTLADWINVTEDESVENISKTIDNIASYRVENAFCENPDSENMPRDKLQPRGEALNKRLKNIEEDYQDEKASSKSTSDLTSALGNYIDTVINSFDDVKLKIPTNAKVYLNNQLKGTKDRILATQNNEPEEKEKLQNLYKEEFKKINGYDVNLAEDVANEKAGPTYKNSFDLGNKSGQATLNIYYFGKTDSYVTEILTDNGRFEKQNNNPFGTRNIQGTYNKDEGITHQEPTEKLELLENKYINKKITQEVEKMRDSYKTHSAGSITFAHSQ